MSSTTPSQTFKYGGHDLQKILVWLPDNPSVAPNTGLWIIYIHGGAWRDPEILSDSFQHTIEKLCSAHDDGSSSALKKIRGIASLDYRLSPNPSFPQDPSSTPAKEWRNARHPDHLVDVRNAIDLLQEKYSFGEKYVVIGHSAGATLAYQLLMVDPRPASKGKKFYQPICVVGIAGIYDLGLVVQNHPSIPEYRSFITGAFGDDETEWEGASPAKYKSFKENWNDAQVALLVRLKGDELVETEQVDVMRKCLQKTLGEEMLEYREFEGGHDEVWEKGDQIAGLIFELATRLSK